MKLKYYLRGMGIGVVATTLVFTIALAIVSANEKVMSGKEQETTQSSILAYTQNETTQTTAKSQEETTNSKTAESSSDNSKTTQAETTQAQTTQAETTQAETVTEEKSVATQPQTKAVKHLDDNQAQIEIGSGYTATEVANMFYEAGIISDREGFINYMIDTGKSVKMLAGTYVVTKGDSFENLAEAITLK